jgi:hypothetical protein
MSLDIRIDEDFKITSDAMNFILERRGIVKESRFTDPANIGNEYWTAEGYYRTIQQVLTDYTRKKVLNSDCKSFQELFQLLEKIKELISRLPDVDIFFP